MYVSISRDNQTISQLLESDLELLKGEPSIEYAKDILSCLIGCESEASQSTVKSTKMLAQFFVFLKDNFELSEMDWIFHDQNKNDRKIFLEKLKIIFSRNNKSWSVEKKYWDSEVRLHRVVSAHGSNGLFLAYQIYKNNPEIFLEA